MFYIPTITTLVVFLSISSAEIFTLSLGNPNQYKASLASTPTLSGSRVLFTEAASQDGGVDVVLSDELRGNIQKAIDLDCKDINTQCVDSVRSLMANPRTELESRQLAAAGAGLFALIALAIPWLAKTQNEEVPLGLHVPASQMDPAASAAGASTLAVITKTDAPFLTITPKPDAPLATGADKPTQTTLSSEQDGHSPGDLAIYLSDDLAGRINEMIVRSQQCDVGNGLTLGVKAVSAQDISEQISGIICAAKALVLDAFPGGPFADLAAIQAKQPAWSAPELVDALFAVVSFAIAQARYLKMTASDATTIAYISFYLAFINIRNKVPLGKVNWIAGSELKGSVTQSLGPTLMTITPTAVITPTGSPSSSSTLECSASCRKIGKIRECNTWCPTPTSVEYYTRPSNYVVKTVAFEPWHVPHQAPFQLENKNPIGVCPPPPGNETDFPLDMFAPVYTKFCEQADKSKDTTMWTVGPDGGHVPAKRSLFRFPSRRADTSQYKDYKFTLASVKREDKKDCLTSCANAYRQLSLQDMCKRGNEKTAIANTGFLDAGCAAYSFSIEMPQVLIDVVCVRPISTVMAAPKFDKSANGAVSIESAARQWCGDRDGQNVDWNEGTKVFEQRWGMSIDDAPDRGEFKLRANLQPNNAVGKIVKSQCIQAFTDGLNACEISSDTTHGFVARLGSIEYTLDVSGELPRSAECSRGADPGRKIDDSDMQKALDAFCVDTRDIKPFGKNWEGTFYYPPSGQPAFYADQTYKMHLNFGAEEWEKSNVKKVNAGDCKFAFRRILKECNTMKDKFMPGKIVYKGVRYTVFHENTGT